MASNNNRHVVKHPDGWAVKAPGASRASVVETTQDRAVAKAKEIVGRLGGGEVRIHGRDGLVRNSDTVKPGRDPFPPRDKR
jgi:hypothetical protein